MRISINAGHCLPYDIGAKGHKYYEAELAYIYASRIYNRLKESGHIVKFICENELQDICNESNKFNADIFISIHLNSATSDSAYGTEVFHYVDSPRGKELATSIQNALKNVLAPYRVKQRPNQNAATVEDIADRGLKTSSLYVTGKKMDAVAVLVEVGFINNPLEEEILLDHHNEIVEAIYDGIVEYIKGRR